MKNNFLKFLIIALAIAFIVPQITLAAWWNPFSWGWLNRVFHFQQEGPSRSLPKSCTDKLDGNPVITSLSAYSGSVGTSLEINGCNFLGFEGDRIALIENDKGEKGILYGKDGSTAKLIKVTLASLLCQKDTSYSGLPCDKYLTLKPGLYKIYTSPWGKKSNEVQFTITDQKLVGGDKDVHGCIGPAGYTWCEAKQKCLRQWEESCQILGDVYPLFSNLKWSEAVAKSTISGDMTVNGYEIKATSKINNNVEASNFFKYYDQKLKLLGWSVNNKVAADGILGSQTGYDKNEDIYIILGYNIKPGKITSGANEPLQWTCPCEVTYSIFTGTNNPAVCPMYCLQNMLCGSDGKDYCNECLVKAAGATVVHKGKCQTK